MLQMTWDALWHPSMSYLLSFYLVIFIISSLVFSCVFTCSIHVLAFSHFIYHQYSCWQFFFIYFSHFGHLLLALSHYFILHGASVMKELTLSR